LDEGLGFLAIACFGDHFNVFCALQKLTDAFTNNAMIVSQQRANFCF
jgi:hypothetical protein